MPHQERRRRPACLTRRSRQSGSEPVTKPPGEEGHLRAERKCQRPGLTARRPGTPCRFIDVMGPARRRDSVVKPVVGDADRTRTARAIARVPLRAPLFTRMRTRPLITALLAVTVVVAGCGQTAGAGHHSGAPTVQHRAKAQHAKTEATRNAKRHAADQCARRCRRAARRRRRTARRDRHRGRRARRSCRSRAARRRPATAASSSGTAGSPSTAATPATHPHPRPRRHGIPGRLPRRVRHAR